MLMPLDYIYPQLMYLEIIQFEILNDNSPFFEIKGLIKPELIIDLISDEKIKNSFE